MKKTGLILSISTLCFIVFGFYTVAYAQEQEQLTILTYYPAPYGVYQNLKATNQVWIGTDASGNPLSGGQALLQAGGTTSNNCAIYGDSTSSYGVFGTSSINHGVYGYTLSSTAAGVYGDNADYAGVKGNSTSSYGVWGNSTTYYGVYGISQSSNGVYGYTNSTSMDCAGVYGYGYQTHGVFGYSKDYSAVYGSSDTFYGVRGDSNASYGVCGESTTSQGVHGESTSSYGVYGESTSSHGVHGESTSSYGIYGISTPSHGVHGESTSSIGVYGKSTSSNGIYGESTSYCGIYAKSNSSYGGYFYSDSGTPIKGLIGTTAGNDTDIFILQKILGYGPWGAPIYGPVFRVTKGGSVYVGNAPAPVHDIAEYLYALKDRDLKKGDVVIIKNSNNMKLEVDTTDKPYDKKVVGVVSSDPTIVMGSQDESNLKIPIAILGIVPVNVDSSYGAIETGDLLTTSPTPSCAMKARHYVAGTIIGKALEPLEKNKKDKILVMLTLQ